MNNYKELLQKEFNIFCHSCKCKEYTNIYVDKKAEELFTLLFGENKLFVFTDFYELLKQKGHSHNHDIFILYSSYPKLDMICKIIRKNQEDTDIADMPNSKIITFPKTVVNYEFLFRQYDLSQITTYVNLPIGYYKTPGQDNIFKIGSKDNIFAALDAAAAVEYKNK